jgi:hypothetical protein
MTDLKTPTKEQVLAAAKDCVEVQRVLEKLFPEAFKEDKEDKEWEDITDKIKMLEDWIEKLEKELKERKCQQ